MNYNIFFIACSVIYANCHEVPNNLPTKYFDGIHWRTMKPQQNVRINDPKKTPQNWQEILRESSEEIKNTKDDDQVPEAFAGFLFEDDGKSKTNIEDLLNILTDGVEIDTRSDISEELSETEEKFALDNTDSNSKESVKVVNISNAIEYAFMKPYLDIMKLEHVQRMGDTSKADDSRDEYKTFLNNRLSAYIPTMRTKHLEKEDHTERMSKNLYVDDEFLEDREIKSFLDVFKAKYDKGGRLVNKTTLSDIAEVEAVIAKYNRNSQKTIDQPNLRKYDIRTYLNAVKSIYGEKNEDKLKDVSLNLPKNKTNHTDHEIFRDDSINRDISQLVDLKPIVEAYAAKYINSSKDISKYKLLLDYFNITKGSEIQTNNSQDTSKINGDLSDRDVSLDLDPLFSKDDNKDSNRSGQMKTHEKSSQEASDVIDKPLKSDEESPISNFKFALDDKEQNAKKK
ncbi:hypothetical protein B5X24_HaOG217069 [Helicoverpa armigera]|uniref:Uncharacterized protein n=1 Tax=Helicoverpa armigera TaxID=29058 RepID=A0A2W1BZK5_HELAM|nr:hypothetical protein B5X24_HaOG217069 [Helicoverpa armigera]